MLVTSVSNIKNNSHTIFGSRPNRKENLRQSHETISSSNSLRKVPVIVLIAMSPLTSANTSAEYQPEIQYTQQVKNDKEITYPAEISRQTINTGSQKCTFIKYDEDYNKNNIEKIGFEYSYLSEDDTKGVLNGFFTTVCSQQTPDRMYYATLYEQEGNHTSKQPKLVKIPEGYGRYLLNFAKSKYNNNAIYAFPKTSYERVYGADSLKSVPEIKDAVTTIVSKDGNRTYLTRPNDYWK